MYHIGWPTYLRLFFIPSFVPSFLLSSLPPSHPSLELGTGLDAETNEKNKIWSLPYRAHIPARETNSYPILMLQHRKVLW